MFWVACYAVPICWVLFAVTSIFSLQFSQLTICAIGCGLAGVNLLGYIRCEKNHKAAVRGFLFTFVGLRDVFLIPVVQRVVRILQRGCVVLNVCGRLIRTLRWPIKHPMVSP